MDGGLPWLPALPRGLADQEGRVGFVSNYRNGIDVIDLTTGSVLWNVDAPARPLAVVGDSLVALTPVTDRPNRLRIVALSISGRGQLVKSCELELPTWVSVAGGEGQTVEYQASVEGRSLALTWHARVRYAGGAAPPRWVVDSARRAAGGVARCDLDTGAVEMLPAERSVTAERAMPGSFPYQVQCAWREEGWVADGRLASLRLAAVDDVPALVLEHWDPRTMERSATHTLLQGSAFECSVTPDGRFLFVHARPREGANASLEWRVFSVTTGSPVARLPYAAGSQAPCVLGDRVYYLVPKGPDTRPEAPASVLRAMELGSGRLLWERDLGEPPRSTPPPLRR